MTARKASLRVAHSRDCANANQTTIDSVKGCTCKPSYFTFYRGRDGRPIKSPRVKDRRTAERALTALQAGIDAGRAGTAKRRTVTFDAWGDAWHAALELAGRRASTVRAYTRSVDFARETFGAYELREIGNPELRRLVAALRDRKQGDVTIAKHLRHLSACFEAALDEDLLERNPVSRFRRTFVLDVRPSEANYFADAELHRLWLQLKTGIPRKDGTVASVAPVYLYLCRFAVASGARIGELVALRWSDVKPAAGEHGEVKITKAWNDVDGETLPKTRKSTRTLHLTADAERVLTEWMRVFGMQDDAALVFPNGRGQHLSPANMNSRVLTPALTAAGISKVAEDSPEPRSFHTFRHCFARLMLERGQPLQWVADELGHESTATTERVYGHWAKAARQQAAAAVPAGALPV
jgi:integrase